MIKILTKIVRSWLRKHDKVYYHLKFKQTMNVKIDFLFLKFYGFLERLRVPESLFLPIMLNADKYVAKNGVKHNEILQVLIMSTLVTHKYWTDVSYANSSIANLTEIGLKEFNALERKFLYALDYILGVGPTEIDEFIDIWTTQKDKNRKVDKEREQLESVKLNVNRMRMTYERYELNRSQ